MEEGRRPRNGKRREPRRIESCKRGELDAQAVEFLPSSSLDSLRQYSLQRRKNWLEDINGGSSDYPRIGRIAIQSMVTLLQDVTRLSVLLNGQRWTLWLFPEAQPHYRDYITVFSYAPTLTIRYWDLGRNHLLLVDVQKPKRN